MSDLIRTFTPELEIRSTAKGGDGRTVEGVCVPYGIEQRIDASLVEVFARGAFNAQLRAPNRIRFTRDHMSLGGSLIGRAVELRDDTAGLWGAFRVSNTDAGNETLELLRDGVLQELSVGFRTRQDKRLSSGTIERTTAHLIEVSVVMEGAYGEGALVSAVRQLAGQREVVEASCTCGAASRSAMAAQILAGLPVLPLTA